MRIPRKKKKKIPKGHYCYEPDYKKNKEENSLKYYYIKPCPFYKPKGGINGYCDLLKYNVMDQVKECGIS